MATGASFRLGGWTSKVKVPAASVLGKDLLLGSGQLPPPCPHVAERVRALAHRGHRSHHRRPPSCLTQTSSPTRWVVRAATGRAGDGRLAGAGQDKTPAPPRHTPVCSPGTVSAQVGASPWALALAGPLKRPAVPRRPRRLRKDLWLCCWRNQSRSKRMKRQTMFMDS